jgi:pimeloyl-ACP methyl ester carboxylesterase
MGGVLHHARIANRHDGLMPDQLTPNTALPTTVASSVGPLAALVASPEGVAHPSTILLVPGYTGSKEDFGPVLDPLKDAGYVAVAIDQPGQNESAGPDQESAYTPGALGPVIASVVTELAKEGRVVMIGHSFGGLVSREAVLVGAPISGLILLCSGPGAFTSGNRYDALTTMVPAIRALGAQAAYDAAQPAAGLDPAGGDPLTRFFRRRFLASSPFALLGMANALLTETDRTPELAAALRAKSIPVAVVAGQADDAWPLDTQRRMAAGLGTDLMLVLGAAHSPAVEAPDALLGVLLPLLSTWLPSS